MMQRERIRDVCAGGMVMAVPMPVPLIQTLAADLAIATTAIRCSKHQVLGVVMGVGV